jgi:hypothetical protein
MRIAEQDGVAACRNIRRYAVRRRLPVLVGVLALGIILLQRQAPAMSIGVGLDWRKNVFVQEYWKDGKVSYAIANKTDTNHTIVVSTYRDHRTVAGPWTVNAHSLIHVAASALIGQDLLQFDLEGGGSLGLMESPVKPAELAQKMIISSYGLNASGGRHNGVWVEQDALAFPSEQVVEMRLRIPGNKGQLMINKGDLARLEVTCKTLNVSQADDRITIDIAHPLVVRDAHSIVLKFKAPKVARPTLVKVDTWLWERDKKGGHGLTRGVVIEPVFP